MLYKATVQILVDVKDDTEACDCIAEMMRPLLREFSPGSDVIDWCYDSAGAPIPDDGRGFEYAPQRGETLSLAPSHSTKTSEVAK